MSNIREIAKLSGLSIATVSRVLNNHPQVTEETRQRVLAAAKEVDYQPSVGRRSTSNVAFAYAGEPTLSSPFDAGLLSGMQREMEEYGYDLMIVDLRRARGPGETYTQMFSRRGIGGIVLRIDARTRPVCEAIAEEGFASVVVGDRFDNPDVNFIDTASRGSSREAVEHLIGLGHRDIAICLNTVDDLDHADRLAGYLDAMKGHGIEPRPQRVIRLPACRQGGAQLVRRIVTMPQRPTAVFVTDPLVSVAAFAEAQATGVRVPADLSILGFDDSDVRYSVYPGMTAVCQDTEAMGREAFAALVQVMENDDQAPTVRKTLEAWFEVHGSTGVPADFGAAGAPARGG